MQLVGDGAVPAGEGKENANRGSWAAQWALLLVPGLDGPEEASAVAPSPLLVLPFLVMYTLCWVLPTRYLLTLLLLFLSDGALASPTPLGSPGCAQILEEKPLSLLGFPTILHSSVQEVEGGSLLQVRPLRGMLLTCQGVQSND